MTFVISAFQMYVLHFGHSFENRKTRVSHTHVYTHTFNDSLSGTTQVSRYQKGKTNLGFTGARDCEWQWHQLGHMQVCTSLQTDNHARTSLLSFLQAGCPSRRPTNSVKALKATTRVSHRVKMMTQWPGDPDVNTDPNVLVTRWPPMTQFHVWSVVIVCPFVRLSVTSRCYVKTAKHRITQTPLHDSPGNLHCESKNKT